jgi:hypothetical protein
VNLLEQAWNTPLPSGIEATAIPVPAARVTAATPVMAIVRRLSRRNHDLRRVAAGAPVLSADMPFLRSWIPPLVGSSPARSVNGLVVATRKDGCVPR